MSYEDGFDSFHAEKASGEIDGYCTYYQLTG